MIPTHLVRLKKGQLSIRFFVKCLKNDIMVVSQHTQPLHVLSCYVIHVHNNKIVTDFMDVLVGGSHQLAVVQVVVSYCNYL